MNAGGVIDGKIEGRDISGGGFALGTVTYLPVYEREIRPFVALTGSAGVSVVRAPADDLMTHSWVAIDTRVGVTVGKTFADRFVPYLAARGFEGDEEELLRTYAEEGGAGE